MTTFFIPGLAGQTRAGEDSYVEMRKQIERRLGRSPRRRRIQELWARRGSVDCVTKVGVADPIAGGIVLAIFDMGAQQPFVVWHKPAADIPDGSFEVLGCSAYSVLEFEG